MATQRRPLARSTVHLLLDTTMFGGFLLVTAPRLTGLAIHEWLSLALGATLITHLLLHWNWIVGVARRMFGSLGWGPRLSYLLNLLIFMTFTVVIFTGLLISEQALPLLGIMLAVDRGWTELHHTASNLSVILIGLHVGLHWRWIVSATRRLFGRREPQAVLTPRTVTTPTEVSQ